MVKEEKTDKIAEKILIRYLNKKYGENWKTANSKEFADLILFDKESNLFIEIKSSKDKSFKTYWGATSSNQLQKAISNPDRYIFYFVMNVGKKNKEIVVIKPKQIFQILGDLEGISKFRNKTKILDQVDRFELDEDLNELNRINGKEDKRKEIAGMEKYLISIDKRVAQLLELKKELQKVIDRKE